MSSVGTVYTAITIFWKQLGVAAVTGVSNDTDISGYGFYFFIATVRTGYLTGVRIIQTPVGWLA